jgi:hypothetical protein
VTVYQARHLTPRRGGLELAVCAATALTVAGLLLAFGPAPGDAEVHLYRTYLVDHGALVWDNLWYDGNFPLATYSLLYYFPAALVGNVPLVVAAVVASTILFGAIARDEWGEAAHWPTRVFAVFAAAPLFTGLYSYALGFTMLLLCLRALQKRRLPVAFVAAALCLGFSPLAFGFLALVLSSVLVARRRITVSTVAVGAGMALLAGFEVLLQRLFPSGGVYPFHLVNLAGVLAVCVLGILLARRARGGGPLAAFFALWALTSAAAWAVATPIGGNWTRLSEVVFPVMLLTAALAGFRPRRLTAVALLAALGYALTPPLLLIPYRLDNRPAAEGFWQPALRYLARHEQPEFRVEVVPTAAHWEAYWIPRAGYALARGWYRQVDMTDNAVLYTPRLGASAYERWLRANAVEYVLLPKTELDPVGGPSEARVLLSRPKGLELVYRDREWTIYRLRRPTPLLTGPGPSHILAFDHTTIRGAVSEPGSYLLRVHFTDTWTTSGACVAPSPNGMTRVIATAPGPFALTAPSAPTAVVRALADDRVCRPAAVRHR